MKTRLRRLWGSSRAWLLLSSLFARGVGFLVSLELARSAGPAALGIYSATVNTASQVGQVVEGLVGTAAPLSAGRTANSTRLTRLLLAYLAWIALAALLLVGPLYYALRVAGTWSLAALHGLPSLTLLALAGTVMVGGLVTTAVVGLLAGSGEFLNNAKIRAISGAALMTASIPMVLGGGLYGALILAGVAAVVPTLLLVAVAIRHSTQQRLTEPAALPARTVAWRDLVASLPSSAALLLNGGVTWVCTTYLVLRIYGPEGVAVVAVSMQWLTLSLMPATAWGNMALAELMQVHQPGDRRLNFAVIRRVLRRNGQVTVVVGALVLLATPWIAEAYRLEDTELEWMMGIFIAVGIFSSLIAVLDRVLLAQGRQPRLLLAAVMGLSVQLVVTLSLIDDSLLGVPIGALAAQLMVLATHTYSLFPGSRGSAR